jgi:hypothetical protein
MIKPNAGKMRGVRVMRDPDGVLLDSFVDESGIQYGYVVVYGEGVPAVHDGEAWHPITTVTDEEWEAKLQELIVEQGSKIASAAATSPVYAELAKIMNIVVGAGVSAPSDQTFVFNSGASA